MTRNYSLKLKKKIENDLEKFDENLLSGDGDHFKSGPELINAFFDVN